MFKPLVLTAGLVVLFSGGMQSYSKEKEKQTGGSKNGMAPRIPLHVFLEAKIEELERKGKKGRGTTDLVLLAFLRELLSERPTVWLSASSVTDHNGMRIEELCDSIMPGCTAFRFEVPKFGTMYGQIVAKWDDPKIITAFKGGKDLAHGCLVFEIKITRETRNPTTLVTERIRTTERYVIFDGEIDPQRVYLLNTNNQIYSVPIRNRPNS